MILISYKYIVNILAFVVAVKTDIQQISNNNELYSSHSNEQVTQYKYKSTVQSVTTENNQDNSITKNLNTEFVQQIYLSNELNLNDTNNDSNVDIKSTDNDIVNKYQSSSSFNYMQYKADQESSDFIEPVPIETSEYEENLITQQSTSSLNLQTTDKSTDTLDKSTGNQPPTSNGNTKDTSNNGGPGTNSPPATNTSPATSTNTPTGVTPPDMLNTPSSKTVAPNSNQYGSTPSTKTSSSGANGSPSGPPTNTKGDLTTVPSDNGKTNGVLSHPYTSTTYPTDIPGYFDQGLPNYNPQSMSPNTGNGVPNSSSNGANPTVATSTPNSYGSPTSPSGDSTDKTNGGDFDSNGNIKSGDNSVLNKHQSSSYYKSLQFKTDQESSDSTESVPTETSEYEENLIIQQSTSSLNLQTTDKSTDTLDKSTGNQPPTSNGNTKDTSNNGGPGTNSPPATNTSPATSTNTPTGVTPPDMLNTPSSKTVAPNSNQYGSTPSTKTSSSGANGSSSGSPTNTKGDLTTVPSDNGKTNGVLSHPYTSTTYPTDIPGYFDQGLPNYNPQSMSPNTGNGVPNSSSNGANPTVATSTPNSYGSPTSPSGDLTDKTNGGDFDSNGNIKSGDNSVLNKYQSSSYYKSLQFKTDQESSDSTESVPIETSEYEENLIIQQSTSSLNLQTTDKSTDTLDKSTGNQPPTSNGNTKDTSNNGGPGTNSPPATNTSPATSTNTPTGVTPPDMLNTPNSKTVAPNSNQYGSTPSTKTSSSGANGSPSGSPTNPKGDLTTVPSDNGKTNGVLSHPYTSTTYPTDIPGYFDQGLPNYNPQSMSPNTDNGVPNSSSNGANPTVATSTPNSYGSPISPSGDSTDKTNGGDFDSNGNIKSGDNSVLNKHQSSSYYKSLQFKTDQESSDSTEPVPIETSEYEENLIIQQSTSSLNLQTTDKSTDTLDKSTGNQPPTSNGNTKNTSNNGGPGTNFPPATNTSPATSTNTPTGVTPPDMLNTPSSKTVAPNSNQYGSTPSTKTSSSGANGSPSGSLTNPKGDLTTVPTDNGKTNGVLSHPYTSTTYPTDIPGYFDQGLPNYNPQSMSPNTGNGVPNSSSNGANPTVATSTPNSYGSPTSPSGDSTDKTNGGDFDSNGNIKSGDNSVLNKHQSSSYYKSLQFKTDQESSDSTESVPTETSEYEENLIIQQSTSSLNLQTTDKSTDTLDKSTGNQPPTSNGNTKDTSNNGGPGTNSPPATNTSPATSTNTPTGVTPPDMLNTPNSKTVAPNSNQYGSTPSTKTSSSGANGSPSGSPTNPKGDLTTVPSDNGKTNGVLSHPYTSTTYPTDIPGYFDQGLPNYNPQSMSPNTGNGVPNSSSNGANPTVATSTPNSYGSPTSPSGDSTDKTNGGDFDSNGNIKSGDNSVLNKYQSSSYYKSLQFKTDQESSDSTESVPIETSEYEENLIIQQSTSSLNLQTTDKSTDTLDKSTGNQPPTSNGNTKDTSNNGGPGTNSPPATNTSPATSTNTPTGVTPPDMLNTPNSKTVAPNSNQYGSTPSTKTSSSGANGSPSGSPTNPKGDLTTVPSDNGKTNGVLSHPYTSTTYPTDIPGYFDQGLPNYNPQSMSPNTGNGVPNSSSNGANPTVATSTPNSYGSPTSPSGDSTDKTNGGDFDSNGNIKSGDNSVLNKHQSSSYYKSLQFKTDQESSDSTESVPTETSEYEENLIIQQSTSSLNLQTTDKSTDTLDKSTGNQPPTSNGNTKDTSNNGGPGTNSPPATNTSPATSTNTPTGVTPPDMLNTPNSKTVAPNSNQYGSTPSTKTSSSGANGSPSGSPTNPKGDLTTVPSDNGKTNGVLSHPYTSTTYPTDIPGYFDQGLPNYNPQSMSPNTGNGVPNSSSNGANPTVATSTPNSYGSPTSPSGDSTDKTNGGDFDSNGNIKSGDNSVLNKHQSSSYYKSLQFKTDQESSDSTEPVPIETSEYEENLIIQQSTSSLNLQTTDKSTDTLDKSTGNQPPTSNGNTKNTSNNGGPGTNSPPATNTSPATSTNTPTGVTPPDMLNTPSSKTVAPNSNQYESTPSTKTSSSGANGSPSGSPTNPKGDLTTVPTDNGKTNGVLSHPYTSTTYPTDIPGYFDQGLPNYNPQSMSPNTGNGVPNSSPNGANPTVATSTPNSYGFPTGDEYAFKSYDDFYGVPQTGYEALTDQISDDYNLGFEYQNDDQINMDNRYIPVNYDIVKYNDVVNTPGVNEDEFYNNFNYEKRSVGVNNMQSSNGVYDLSNYGNNVDDYYDDNKYDNGNQPEYSYDTYEANFNAMYENNQMQYGLNQHTPPSSGYSLNDNDNRPYDTNIYPSNGVPMSYNPDVYNYDNRINIQYGNDQSGIGIDDINPDTKVTPTFDSYSNIDMESGTSYDSVNGNNKGREIIDSLDQVNENTAYNGQTFNKYIQLGNLPEYYQLNDDYSTTYLSNLQTFEASSSSKTGTNIPDGPYLTPKLINSDYNSLPINNLDKQSSDLNGLLIDSTELNGDMYGKIDASNVNAQVGGLTEDSFNGFPGKTADDLSNPTRNIDLSKNNALDVGQNVYGANGQVIGKIFKPSNDTRKNNNRQKYSGSSSYSSLSDSEFSEDMHAIGHDIERAARDAVDNIYDKTKDAYDTAKNVGKAVGNAVGNAANNVYQGTKEVAKDVGNAVGKAANAVKQTANNAYQNTKNVVNGMEDVASDTADGIKQTAKTAYQGTKDVINGV